MFRLLPRCSKVFQELNQVLLKLWLTCGSSVTLAVFQPLQPIVGSGCRAGQHVCSGLHPHPQKGPLTVEAVRAVERVGGSIACWLRAEGEDTPVGQTLGSQREQWWANHECWTEGHTGAFLEPLEFHLKWSPRFFHTLSAIGPLDVEQLWILPGECGFGLSVVVWTPVGFEVRDCIHFYLSHSFAQAGRSTHGSNLDILNKPHVFF